MSDQRLYDASRLHERGRKLYQFGQFEAALELYEEALRLDPDNPRLWYDKGNVFRNWHRQLQGPVTARHSDAIGCYQRAVSLDPDFADAWGNMGVSYGASGEHEQALSCFTNALRIQPADEQWKQMREIALQKVARATG